MKLVVAVLMLLILGALGEVVDDFKKSKCSGIFLNSQPPVFIKNNKPLVDPSSDRYKQICQKLQNVYHYATLYDTEQKIPVYSAYQYLKTGNCNVPRPNVTWKIEPQLEGRNRTEMELLGSGSKGNGKQAYNSEYDDSRYDKGHLYPHCHAPSNIAANSTFTLTNAAPQRCDFNKFWYSKVENEVRKALDKCTNKRYVVTGVVPSIGSEIQTLKQVSSKVNSKVNVPSHFWTAYCCCDNNDQCEFGGYSMHKEADVPTPKFTAETAFNKNLGNLYNMQIKVFNDACVKKPVKRPRE